MPLNVGDYLRDTGHLSATEHGAYLMLILRYWQDGGLPTDENLIRRYSLLSVDQWSESRPVLAALFGDDWKHKRIDDELAKAADIIGKRKAAGQQRQSKGPSSAEQVLSTSSYTGAKHKHKPLPDTPATSVEVSEGARDLFDEVWEVFPRNPTSSEAKAEAAFRATKAKDQTLILAAAQRYSRWFTDDCERRKRTVDAGLSFVPHLSTWIETGAWKDASALPIKAEKSAPVVAMTRIDRVLEPEVWTACERLQGKRAPTSDTAWAFPAAIVESARREVSAGSSPAEVH